MQSKNFGYLEKMDHLRFLAAFTVIMFHTEITMHGKSPSIPFPVPLFHEGHTGVPLFMVISGMILSMIAYGRNIDILRFYGNRILRIYPVFVVVVSLGYFATPDPRATSVGIDFLMSLLPISNLYRLQYGMFGGHLWSIAVELQFYLLFPFLIIAIERFGERFAWGIVALTMVLRTAVYFYTGAVHHMAFLSLFGNIDIFIAGVLAGRHYMQDKRNFNSWIPILVLLANNVIIYFIFSKPSFFHFDYGGISTDGQSHSKTWILWPTIQGVMWAILAVTYLRSAIKLPFSGAIALIGKYSYSIYAWHILVLFLMLKTTFIYQFSAYWVALFIVLPLTVGLSALSYYVIETPFLAMRMKYVT